MCHVRYIYSALLSLLLTIIDPLSILFLLHSFGAFNNATILTWVSLLDYLTSFLAVLTIHLAHVHSPRKLVDMCNEWRRLYLAIDSDHRRRALWRFATRRSVLSLAMAVTVMSANVFCINYLTKTKDTSAIIVVASVVASLPTLSITLVLVIYNTTMHLVLETFQQINRRLQALMNALEYIEETPHHPPSGQDQQQQQQLGKGEGDASSSSCWVRVRNFRKLKNFCDISDQIDALAILHKNAFEFTRTFNRHYGLVMLVFVLNVFCAIVSQAFFLYMNVANLIGRYNGAKDAASRVDLQFSAGSVFYALMVTVQMWFVVEATSAVIDIGRSTGLQLHQAVSSGFDERLEQSVRSHELLVQNYNSS